MGLLAPLSLILFIPIAGAIILFYLLKLKRKERTISSVFLWRHAIQDVQANAPFQKLKKNLLLFIQLSTTLLIIAALARPFYRAVGLIDQNIVVILDSSASMNAVDVSGSRFEQARKLAFSTVERMGKGDSMLVITASAKTRVASSFTSDKKALTATIKSLKPRDTRANLREAMVLALSLVAKKKNPQIVVISDGGFAEVIDINPGKAKINFIKVGKRSDNVGIIALDARKTLSGTRQVFVGIRNFSDSTKKFNLEVYLNDQLTDVIEESLEKGALKQEILTGLPQAGGRLTIKIDIKDDLASDNQASVYLAAPKKLSVLLVTPGNIFLEQAFNLNPQTELTKTSESPKALSGYDIMVFDRITPPNTLPKGGYLLINTSAKAGPAQLSNKLNRPSIVDWIKNHPTASYVDFSGINLEEARSLKMVNWGQGLVESEVGPIAAVGEQSGSRFVMLGWDLTESDFPLRVGFPIFITNCIEWLSGSRLDEGNVAVHTGDIIRLDAQGNKDISITNPDGDKINLHTNGTVIFDDTERAGVYRFHIGKKSGEFACNLLSPAESDTTPKGELKIGERQITSDKKGIRTNREYWRIMLIIGLMLLTFEWYVFHRRFG